VIYSDWLKLFSLTLYWSKSSLHPSLIGLKIYSIILNPDWSKFQVAVWGDYGGMVLKVLMGIAQIRLELLHLRSEPVQTAWFKLFHASSVHGMMTPASQGQDDGGGAT